MTSRRPATAMEIAWDAAMARAQTRQAKRAAAIRATPATTKDHPPQ
jgi:hypothetical protein